MEAKSILSPVVLESKRCNKCKQVKPVACFSRLSRTKDRLETICKDCYNERSRKRREHTLEYQRTRKKRYPQCKVKEWQLKARTKKLGLTPAEYNTLLTSQAGVCAICGQPETVGNQHGARRLSIDHNHETGALRGLLCHRCNCALGHFRDDTSLMHKAIAYLESYAKDGD